MMDRELQQLAAAFGDRGASFRRGAGELIFVTLANALGQAEICLQGATVLSFVPQGARDLLWVSREAVYAPDRAIRGGVPICWPWFGAHPDDEAMPAHGFARFCPWTLREITALPSGMTKAVLYLDRAMVPERFAPRDFELEYTVTVGQALTLELSMTNCDVKIMEISAALHSYFAVGDIGRTEVVGLGGAEFIDALTGRIGCGEDPVRFTAETDRIYPDSAAAVRIDDRAGGRRIELEKIGSRSTVVWNPWIAKAAKLTDFGDDEYREMLCVETGILNRDTRRLAPGESWILGCRLSTV